MAVGFNPVRGILGGGGAPVGGGGFNPFAAGTPGYGPAGTAAGPNTGPVSAQGQQGYVQREQQNQLYRNAISQRAAGGY